MRVYIVKVNEIVSQEAYKTLEEAQKFVISRVGEDRVKDQKPYYKVSSDDYQTRYEISDVFVEGV